MSVASNMEGDEYGVRSAWGASNEERSDEPRSSVCGRRYKALILSFVILMKMYHWLILLYDSQRLT